MSLTSAAVAWLLAEPVALRLLVALTAAAGVTGAVVMRNWDRAAGRRVAELTRERVREEWRSEDRIAELESELEESRAVRARLDAKLRAKRVELAGLRGEHAALLRRYATAETERASALEGRRLLAIEVSAPAGAKELPAPSEERTTAGAPTPVGYARAHAAMAALARKAETRKQTRAVGPGRTPAALPAPRPGGGNGGGDGKSNRSGGEATAADGAASGSDAPAAPEGEHARPGAPALPERRRQAVVAPYAGSRTASRVEGGFDFFGTKTAAQAKAAIEAVQNEDLADVVGAEALAVHKAESADPEFKPREAGHRAVGQVIDLTAHDETEAIDVGALRTAIS
ncbi:hypothetical protein ACIQUQ_09105 [Streptomyces sp. NPDC101118]|uniref:hypothetical protein n=1 Tax=Streptomyces sp. NPDC101118 TaxID=3366109 RepID=UPI0038237439